MLPMVPSDSSQTNRIFRNEMHLGPSAHRLMGTEIFHGIEEMWLR